ncbi:hypothetical protein CMUS01_14644, partial [Colletotrichum musicola]
PRTPQQPGLEVRYDTTPPTSVDDSSRPGDWSHPPHDGHSYTSPAVEQKILAIHNGYEPISHQAQNYTDAGGSTLENQRAAASSPRRPWLLLALGGLVVFVLAGVIGGVAGWRVTADLNQRPAGDSNPGTLDGDGSGGDGGGTGAGTGTGGGKTSGGGITVSGNATQIMQNSALAAVGWRIGSDFTVQLFFQGPDSRLRRLQYTTLYQNWTAPIDMDAAPRAGAPLGASQLWIVPDPTLPGIPQAELFYIGSPDKILGINWRDGYARAGLGDSINGLMYRTDNSGTQMAAYWPSMVVQASNGDVMDVTWDYESGFQAPKRIGVTASPGTALVMLPRESLHSAGDPNPASSARIVYRDTTGRLRNFDRSAAGLEQVSSGELPVTVDANFTMGGFAVARLDSDGKRSLSVNTWILYQDSKTGNISYVYEDDASGWKGPKTDPVFDGADKATHIACVTAASAKVPQVPLEGSHDLSHCFFQVDKKLKHVHFDGKSWEDMGIIPIP